MNFKKTLSFLIKIGIVVFSLYFLYKELVLKNDIINFDKSLFFKLIDDNIILIVIVLFLMFLNWFLEALKWRYMISKIEKVSIYTSLKAVFAGITVSSFTPNRVGEYGGRVFYLEKADRLKGVIVTFIGSMSQLLITILFGSISFIILSELLFESKIFFSAISKFKLLVFLLLFLLNVFIFYFFYNVHSFISFFNLNKYLNRFKQYIQTFTIYNSRELTNILLFSFSRYIVFSIQFLILLNIFEIDSPTFNSMLSVMLFFLFVSIIPTIFVAEIGVRGSVAIYVFSLFTINSIGVFSSTLLLWIINLVIPSLIGIYFVFNLNFFRK
ncbi:flippase-like domain-containing protein [Flavobacteriales bacterium]|nr:flippase-like domain-containing protein [Flavobacteriales bacterium]